MYRALRPVAVVAAIAVVAVVAAGAVRSGSVPAATALKSHHLFNLASSVSEAELAAAVAGLNGGVARAGYAQAGYRVWKVTGQQAGTHAYMMEGNWPSQAAYDSIHAHAAYSAAFEQQRATLDRAMQDRLYNRYFEIPTAATR